MRILSSLATRGAMVALVGTACAGTSSYVYTPDSANATEAGLPASRTPIPQERPEGAIEVTSYGITDLSQDRTRVPALHVRAVVSNDGDDQPWTLDTTQQLVEIPGEGRSRALFANSDAGTMPRITIGKHERRVIDLYFPLPDTIHKASQLGRFDLLWQVDTASRTVASRTSFERVNTQPEVAYETAPLGWPLWAGYGPYWWYDPFYPRVVFLHSRPIVVHPGRVAVGHFGGQFRAGTGHVAVRPR